MRLLRLTILPLAMLSACEDDGTGGSDATSVATYNAGLAPGFVGLVDERTQLATTAIAEFDATIFCAQEIWDPADWQAVQALVPGTDARDLTPRQRTDAGCEAAEIGPLSGCISNNCSGDDVDLQTCVLSMCQTEVAGLSEGCFGCLAANLGAGDVSTIVGLCLAEEAPQLIYGGSYGLGLLSRLPILNDDFETFDSFLVRRGVLHAELEMPDQSPLHVFCTHLSTPIAGIPHPAGATGWEDEQAAQIDALLSYVRITAQNEPTILLGDFNTGPTTGNATEEIIENYRKFIDDGFLNPYVAEGGDCTFCGTNNLVTDDVSIAIDHIFTKGVDLINTQRVFEETVTVDVAGTATETALSDHFGVFAEIDEPAVEDPPAETE